jgi:hypothetical protein
VNESANNPGFLSKHAKDIVVIVLLALLVYVMVEQAVRFSLFGPAAFSYRQMNSIKSLGRSGFVKASEYDEVVYDLKPGLDTEFKLVSFRTNSHGLRDKEYAVKKPPDTYRVAVVGGSFTMGAGVEIEDTFHSRLEDRLNRELDRPAFEFINFGVAGYTIRNKLAVLEHKVMEYEPDLVILVLDGSQFTDEEFEEFVPKSKKSHFFTSYSFKLLKKVDIFKSRDEKAAEFINEHMGHLNELEDSITKLGEFSEEHGIPVCIVVLDHDYQHYKLGEKIGESVMASNLCFSNTLPAFKDTYFRDYTIYKVDMHPNAEANRLFAEAIYRDLKQESLPNKSETRGVQDD